MELNYFIEGIGNKNQSIASQGKQKDALKPLVDAVQQFKLVTNGFAADGPIKKIRAFLFGDLELTGVRESDTAVSTRPQIRFHFFHPWRRLLIASFCCSPITPRFLSKAQVPPQPLPAFPAPRASPRNNSTAFVLPAQAIPKQATAVHRILVCSLKHVSHSQYSTRRERLCGYTMVHRNSRQAEVACSNFC